jgi:hypothetical protein
MAVAARVRLVAAYGNDWSADQRLLVAGQQAKGVHMARAE